MAITAHDDQIDIGISRNREDGRLNICVIGAGAFDARDKPALCQVRDQSRGGFLRGYFRRVDGDDGDGVRTSQKRRGVAKGARGQTASIPGNADVLRFKRPLWVYGIKRTGPPD